MNRIAHIENNFTDKFGIPRQSGLVDDVISTIVFEPKYRNPDAIKGLEGFSHLWIIWMFDAGFSGQPDSRKQSGSSRTGSLEASSREIHDDCSDSNSAPDSNDTWSPMVRPPKLGGNMRMGVFATRSPNRPNPIGLSCVRIVEICDSDRGPLIKVAGADLKNNTPILDIKPYLPFTDSHPDASSGFTDSYELTPLTVHDPDGLLNDLPKDTAKAVVSLLAQDPRPSFHDDPSRIYGMKYAGYDIHFSVSGDILNITGIDWV